MNRGQLFLKILIIVMMPIFPTGFITAKEKKYADKDAFAEGNKTYYIAKDYHFQSDTVKVGKNSSLFFLGGSIIGGNLQFDNVTIKGRPLFVDCSMTGSVSNKTIKMKWFKGDFSQNIRSAVEISPKEGSEILFEKEKEYMAFWRDRSFLVSLKDNMVIEGNNSTIKIADGVNSKDFTWGCIFRITRTKGVTIKNLTMDFNGEHNDILQDMSNIYWERNGLVIAEFADGLTIFNCHLLNNRGCNDITVFSSKGVKIHDCKFINSGQIKPNSYLADHSSLLALDCKNCEIYNNRIENDVLREIGSGYDVCLEDSYFHDNYVDNNYNGMNLSAINSSKNVRIEGNKFVDNTFALTLWSYGKSRDFPNGRKVEDITIKNNTFRWTACNGQYYCRGINFTMHTLGVTRNVIVDNNQFESTIGSETDMLKSFEYAIYVGVAPEAVNTEIARAENIIISNNIFSTTTGPAIRLTDKAFSISITDNTFKDCSCSEFENSGYGVIAASVENRTTLSDVEVSRNRFNNDRYNRGKYAVALYNSLSNVDVRDNDIKLLSKSGLFIAPEIRELHSEKKDIVFK